MNIFSSYLLIVLTIGPQSGILQRASAVDDSLRGKNDKHVHSQRILNTECPCAAIFQDDSVVVGTIPSKECNRLLKRTAFGEKLSTLPEGSDKRIVLRNTTLKHITGNCDCDAVFEISGTWKNTDEFKTYSLTQCNDICEVHTGSSTCKDDTTNPVGSECPCGDQMYGNTHLGTIQADRSEDAKNSASKLVNRALNGGKVNMTHSGSRESIILKNTTLYSEFMCGCNVHSITGIESESKERKKYTLRCCNDYCLLYEGSLSCFIKLPSTPIGIIPGGICSDGPITEKNLEYMCVTNPPCPGGTGTGIESDFCDTSYKCYTATCPIPIRYNCGFTDGSGSLIGGPGWNGCDLFMDCTKDASMCPLGMGCFRECGPTF